MERHTKKTFKIGQAIGAAEVHLVPVAHKPGSERHGLGQNGEIRTTDTPAEGQDSKDTRCHRWDHESQKHCQGEILEGFPKQWQSSDAVPHHEIWNTFAIYSLATRLEHEIHAHGI